MKDGIIKGDGTSRLARANIPETYAEFRAQLAAGTLPLDILFNEAGWSQRPDFLNKANLMDDETCSDFRIPPTSVPNDLFRLLSLYHLYRWQRTDSAGRVSYRTSHHRHDYPDDGAREVGGSRYLFQGSALENAVGAAKPVFGSYTGTGTHGASGATKIIVPGGPVMAVAVFGPIYRPKVLYNHGLVVMLRGVGTYAFYSPDGSGPSANVTARFTDDGHTLEWWADKVDNTNYTGEELAGIQANAIGEKYHYIALAYTNSPIH